MGDAASTQVLFEIEGLVSDALQVISYKWLSRKFSVPSNTAKRLLEQFVTENKQLDLQIVYAVSGWTKKEPQCYAIQLVPKSKLEGVKAALKENPSVHVYSVQRSLPKDPAQLWSADFVQAVELFDAPQDTNNCLRDNRHEVQARSNFACQKEAPSVPSNAGQSPGLTTNPGLCGHRFSAVTCTTVQRNLKRSTSGSSSSPRTAAPAPKPANALLSSSTHAVQNATSLIHPLTNVDVDLKQVKSEIPAVPQTAADNEGKDTWIGKSDKKASTLPPAAGKRKAVGFASPAGKSGGGAISNLWGKAASKPPKAPSPSKASEPIPPSLSAGDAEAGIQKMEADVYSDDDVDEFASSRIKRVSGRRRMIVEDDDSGNEGAEEDEEMIVRLSTPDSPQDKKPQLRKGHDILLLPKKEQLAITANVPTAEANVSTNGLQHQCLVAGNLTHGRGTSEAKEEKPNVSAQEVPGSGGAPKRKKVMHTKIDERGREVTEVVWETEGEGMHFDKESQPVAALNTSTVNSKQTDSKTPLERPRALPKPLTAQPKAAPSKGSGKNAGKANGKQGKQQGTLTSFFKKQ